MWFVIILLVIVGLICLGNLGKKSEALNDTRDGNVYRTVKIGNQVWMAQNLNCEVNGSWCYGNDEANGKKYGRLYTWDAAKVACPVGWHLPSRQEWNGLVVVAGGERVAGKYLKARSGWDNNGNGTDVYGFSALPSGKGDSGDDCSQAGENGYWWTATEYESGSGIAYRQNMGYDCDCVIEGWNGKDYGYSVRCVKDL
jgi:uncharacterized protein (TIGR02145 family)